MSPANNTLAGKPAGKDESQSSSSRKPSSARPQEPAVKCPRCDSPNTKFCYYNNYSLTQPRHFCKTCRRYWTKGGALRNVPIGGGCRKNKKLKSSPRLSGDSRDSSGSSDVGGLKFFQGLSPAMDFQLGGINMPKLHSSNTNLFNPFQSFGDLSNATSAAISQTPCFNPDPPLMGFGFPLSSSLKQGENFQAMGSLNVHSNLATSIESLSSINQDLHWKLQQQRLATLFAEDGQNQKEASRTINEPVIQKPQPIQFQNLENPKTTDSCLNIGTSRNEWFFNTSYAGAVAPTPATSSSSNLNGNGGNWSSGIQAWTELSPYTSLP
ncbi:hypothetical protein C2S51_032034 [Perilla frutescens var. frutescens]|nr:hypothetical protein C2S51_032034 [Perilla frutescens var. frutescens]